MSANAVSVAKILSELNPIASTIVTLIGIWKASRDAAKAANPTAPDGTFPTDAELIERVLTEAGLLKAEAGALRAWLATQTE